MSMLSSMPGYRPADAAATAGGFGLTGPHAAQAAGYLAARAVAPAVAAARGYRTPTSDDLDLHGLQGEAREAALIAIPLYGLDGDPLPLPQLGRRRDLADVPGWPSRMKFRSGRGAPVHGTIHPGNIDAIHDRDVPLVLTEGVVKADSILSTVGMDAVGVVAYLGVDLPTLARGDRRGPRPGDVLERRGLLRGRLVLLAFDGDALSRPGVARGVDRAAAVATAAGAHVRIMTVPGGLGIDDYLAAHAAPSTISTPQAA